MDAFKDIVCSTPSPAPAAEESGAAMSATTSLAAHERRLQLLEQAFYQQSIAERQRQQENEQLRQRIHDLEERDRQHERELEDLRRLLLTAAPSSQPDALLEFNFRDHPKKDIYAYLLDGLRQGYFNMSTAALERFLATHSNLGSQSSIHSQLYIYK